MPPSWIPLRSIQATILKLILMPRIFKGDTAVKLFKKFKPFKPFKTIAELFDGLNDLNPTKSIPLYRYV